MSGVGSILVCSGCGHQAPPGEPRPFRCPSARPGDDVDHVLRRRLAVDPERRERLAERFLGPQPNPFLRYRDLLHSHHAALAGGLSDEDYSRLVVELDERVATVAGSGFRETPFGLQPALAGERGCDEVRGEAETGDVGGHHTGRHLRGRLICVCV